MREIRIVKALRGEGHEAYFVGGFVRDRIMGRTAHDIDITTSATPEEIQGLFPKTLPIGTAFGVVHVVVEGEVVEVATFRAEGSYFDGRRPSSVSFSKDAREDVVRRDFTINGLLFDPIADEVIDHVGGIKDILAKVIRAIGNPEDRFRDDHLRMLRAIRFAANFGFSIEETTFKAIKKFAPQIGRISQERIRDEFTKTLLGGNPALGMALAKETGIMDQVIPEIGENFSHNIEMLRRLPKKASIELAMAALLTGLEEGVVEAVCRRLKFPSQTIKRVRELVENHRKLLDVQRMKRSTLMRLLAKESFSDLLELHRMDCLASGGDMAGVMAIVDGIDPSQLNPPALVTGQDLVAMGLKPGPAFGQILKAIEDGQLEGDIETREQAIFLARKWVKKEVDSGWPLC